MLPQYIGHNDHGTKSIILLWSYNPVAGAIQIVKRGRSVIASVIKYSDQVNFNIPLY
jgi:hypothetical protein